MYILTEFKIIPKGPFNFVHGKRGRRSQPPTGIWRTATRELKLQNLFLMVKPMMKLQRKLKHRHQQFQRSDRLLNTEKAD